MSTTRIIDGWVIDNGVPPPPKAKPGPTPETQRRKFPFKDMAVGESLFMRCTADGSTKTQAILADAAKRAPFGDWTTRKVKGGVRIWRIK